jgi:mRNA-degrading endonuclease toxin of MazEF toxin-antitoxin module
MLRGDVVLMNFPFTTGVGAKIRPAVVVQCDANNRRISSTIVAMISSKTMYAHLPTQLLIDPTTLEGKQSGLLRTSVVKSDVLHTVEVSLLFRKIGQLHPTFMTRLDTCLKWSLSLT